MLIVTLLITLVLIGMAGIAVVNALVFPRLGAFSSQSFEANGDSTPSQPPPARGRSEQATSFSRSTPTLLSLSSPLLEKRAETSPPAGRIEGGRNRHEPSGSFLNPPEKTENSKIPPSGGLGGTPPHISILIPARNEAAVIEATVRHLLAQTYPHFELIVLDDNSTDDTLAILKTIQAEDSRLRVIRGQPLPEGWLGKMWGCHQLAQAAQEEWLIFTDADVRWQPDGLAALVTEIGRTQADLLTIWPTQQTESWAERLVVPLMALVVIGYLPLPFVHHTSWPMFAAANGQCLAFRRRAYDNIGGHHSVWNEVLEDVVIARRVKAHGLRLRMADGAGLIGCRMYRDWPTVRDGYAKNILAGYGNNIIFLGLATLFHGLVFLWPWLWLILGAFDMATLGWPTWPLILIALGIILRALTAAVTRQRLGDALLMPLSVVLMTAIAGRAVWWQWRYGGPRWKGRTIVKKEIGGLGDWEIEQKQPSGLSDLHSSEVTSSGEMTERRDL